MVYVRNFPMGRCSCGAEPQFVEPLFRQPYVECKQCGARGPRATRGFGPAMQYEAAAGWNALIKYEPPKRPPPPLRRFHRTTVQPLSERVSHTR